jgi:hypothetical protein
MTVAEAIAIRRLASRADISRNIAIPHRSTFPVLVEMVEDATPLLDMDVGK